MFSKAQCILPLSILIVAAFAADVGFLLAFFYVQQVFDHCRCRVRFLFGYTDNLDTVGNIFAQTQLVDGGIEAYIVGAKGVQDLPDDAVLFVVVKADRVAGCG
jgi:hypothetical protein